MLSNPLIGTWRLLSCENRGSDSEVSYPFGQDARGYIMYQQDGYMSVAIMRAHRASFSTGDLFRGSPAEKVTAAESYFSDCGRYDFQGDKVIHHIELSLFPNWVGSDQERFVELTGDRLVLSTRPMVLEGKQQTAHLVWTRV